MSKTQSSLTSHAIQAEEIFPRELYIRSNVVPSNITSYEGVEPELSIGYSNYDPEGKEIHIRVTLEMGKAELPAPFHLKVELMGLFRVDESKFPVARLEEWAQTNALFIFHPYLREQVFALTARCGFLPVLLPLVTVPTVVIGQQPD
jgi:preprotein translocase subunit SecB